MSLRLLPLVLVVGGAHGLIPCARAQDDDCIPDPLRVAKWPVIADAIKIFHLENTAIAFESCSGTVFHTIGKRDASGTYRYSIRYQIISGDADPATLTAPLLHELAHVFQAKRLGSFLKLTSQPRLPNELSADFLTGLVFAKLQDRMSMTQFQQNLILSGDFDAHYTDAHGTPLQRRSAFRMGAFFDRNKFGDSLADADDEFRHNRLGAVLERK